MTELPPPPQKGIRRKGKFEFYGMPRFGSALILNFRDFATYLLYTTVFGLSSDYAGWIIFLSYVTIAISQFSMTSISDRTNTRWGRRRPFVLFGTPVLAISFFMLFTPLLFLGKYPSESVVFVWFLVWKCSFEFFYGFVTSPYQAMMPEIMTVSERPKASFWQNLFGMLGTGLGFVLTLLVMQPQVPQITATRELPPTFIAIFLTGAIVTIILFLLLTRIFRREEPQYMAKHSLKENLREALRNKNFLRVTILQGIASLAWAMIFAVILGYLQDVLHFTSITFYITAIVLVLGILVFLAMWRKIIEKKGKKWVLEKLLIIGVLFFPISLVGIAQGSDFTVIGIIIVLFAALTLGGWYLFPYLLYADLAEDDARRTDNFKAGVYAGFPSIPLNLFQGFSYIITGYLDKNLPPLLGSGNPPSRPPVSWFYVIWGPLASIYLIIAYIYLKKRVVLDFAWEKEVKEQRRKEKEASNASTANP